MWRPEGLGSAILSLLAVLICSGAGPVSAQQAEAGSTVREVTPLVNQDHWSLDAARRLEGAGLTDAGYDPGTGTVTVGRLARLFREAVDRANRAGRAGVRDLAEGYRDRFREEFPGVFGGTGGGAPAGAGDGAGGSGATAGAVRWLGGSVGAGYRRETGRVLAGRWPPDPEVWSGPRPLPDISRGTGEARLLAGFDSWAAASVTPAVGDGLRLREGHLAAGVGAVTFWTGRRAFRFGATDRGGLVASEPDFGEPVYLDGGGVSTESFRLPWIFRYLGPFRIETAVVVVDRNGDYDDPWLLLLRGRIAPHPRVSIGVNRGAMYGGEGNVSIPFHEVLLRAVLGARPGQAHGFDNQVVSVDVRFRPPLGDFPLVLFGEWGAEDSSGAHVNVPGLLGGIELTAVPGLSQVSLGAEVTHAAESCCGNPPWYRHRSFQEGWSEGGRLLGHPLGGHGTELRVYGRIDALHARLRVRGSAYLRDRRGENVFAPERAGESRGFELGGTFRVNPRLELSLSTSLEAATGEGDWSRSDFATGVVWLF